MFVQFARQLQPASAVCGCYSTALFTCRSMTQKLQPWFRPTHIKNISGVLNNTYMPGDINGCRSFYSQSATGISPTQFSLGTSACITYASRRLLHMTSITRIKFRRPKENVTTEEETRITRQGYFEMEDRNKENFIITIELFKEKEKLLRGHVAFIKKALSHMEEFGVHKDLEVYKKLLDVFPKVKMIPQNMFQVEFFHYPEHQDCGVEVLHQMENNGVIPDTEVQDIIMMVFGRHSSVMKKFGRMNYWMTKFNNASPWPLPKPVPNDAFELAILAVTRMCTVDQASEVSVLHTKDLEDSIDDTWIVSGQSVHQRELLDKQPEEKPLRVEGPFRIFLREESVNYFTLSADYRPLPQVEEIDKDDITTISSLLQEDATLRPNTAITVKPSVHEQEDGTILAICVTGTSSRDSLLSWVRLLGATNPRLEHGLPVVFLQASPGQYADLATIQEQQTGVQSTQQGAVAEDGDKHNDSSTSGQIK